MCLCGTIVTQLRPQADTVGVVERVLQARFVGRMWTKVEDLECIQSLFVLNKKFRQLSTTPLVAIMFFPLYFIGAKERLFTVKGRTRLGTPVDYDPPGS